MNIYDLIIQNKEFLKVFYAFIIGIICLIIVLKTNRLFKLSSYQGIRYFRNAFFFYGLAFIIRYFFIEIPRYIFLTQILFESFLIMAGFSLLYSLLWKRFEGDNDSDRNMNSLFNARFIIFYSLALIIAVLDYLWKTYYFMFLLQIIIFSYATSFSYSNYKKNTGKEFSKLYFIAIALNFIAWFLNFIAATFFEWNQAIMINIYIINIVIFFLFLYGIFKLTKKIN